MIMNGSTSTEQGFHNSKVIFFFFFFFFLGIIKSCVSFRPFRPTVEFSVSSRVKDTKLIYNSSQEKKKKKKKKIFLSSLILDVVLRLDD